MLLAILMSLNVKHAQLDIENGLAPIMWPSLVTPVIEVVSTVMPTERFATFAPLVGTT